MFEATRMLQLPIRTVRRAEQARPLRTWIVIALLVGALAPAVRAAPPATPRRPVVDEYWGTKVQDDYQWLEDGSDPAVRAWSDAQNAVARKFLDGRPGVAALRARLAEILGFRAVSHFRVVARKDMFFALEDAPPRQQPALVRFTSFDDLASVTPVVDPNAIDAKGGTAIDFYVPSVDGKLVAVSMSRGGSESGDVAVYEVATGTKRPDLVPRVNGGTAGGSLCWNADGSGFWYTRYPRAGERPAADMEFFQQVWFHRLGTDTKADTYVIGKDFPRIAEIALQSSEDGAHQLAVVENGDGGEYAIWLGGTKGFTRVADFADQVVKARFGRDGALWLLSRKDAPRGRLLRLLLDAPELANAKVVVPEPPDVIDDFAAGAGVVYVSFLAGGPSAVGAYALDGTPAERLQLPPVVQVGQLVSPRGDELYLRVLSYTKPGAWYRYAGAGKVAATKFATPAAADFSNVEVLRETAVSKDGTRVPMTILRRKGTRLDGGNPLLLYAYGGYGISERPRYWPDLAVWFARGGVYVDANLRGGGEFGEAWHRAGHLTHKQNVFDDFVACAKRLVELKYTRPERLAIMGGSNGGLLMGAVLTEAPQLFRAVVSYVGIYDSLRVELQPNGAFNVTEFGTVRNKDQFKALYAYSPYHNVKDGLQYPAVLLLTGANDPRVDPSHSRKFAARLQAASKPGRPILLRTSANAGHGVGSALSEVIGEEVDQYAFLFDQLGMK